MRGTTKRKEKPGVRGKDIGFHPSSFFPIKMVKKCTIPLSLVPYFTSKCVWRWKYIFTRQQQMGSISLLRRNSCCILHIICIEGEDINRCTGALDRSIISQSTCSWRALVIQIHNDHSNIIVKMSPYSLFYSFYIVVFHFSFLCSLLEGSSHQSFSYPLEGKDNISDLLNRSLALKKRECSSI